MTTPKIEFQSIDWATWQPDENATLMFILDGDQILLIRKKRGLGAGKINAPGGRLEGNESMLDCAIRETQEELGVNPVNASLRGRHRFQFADGYALQVFVYQCFEHEGVAVETDEAKPLWTPINQIPYDEMWADDRVWLPLMLNGDCFSGDYLFDDDTMIDYVLEKIEDPHVLLP